MENIAIARLLDETASLLEIDAADAFRIRSYRRAAEAVEQQTTQLAALATSDPKALLAIPGIGKGMAANICLHGGDRRPSRPRRAAHQIQTHHAGAASPPRHGAENSRARLVRARRLRHRRPRSRRARRQAGRAPAHGREIHRQTPQGHRRLPPQLRPLPHRQSAASRPSASPR